MIFVSKEMVEESGYKIKILLLNLIVELAIHFVRDVKVIKRLYYVIKSTMIHDHVYREKMTGRAMR